VPSGLDWRRVMSLINIGNNDLIIGSQRSILPQSLSGGPMSAVCSLHVLIGRGWAGIAMQNGNTKHGPLLLHGVLTRNSI